MRSVSQLSRRFRVVFDDTRVVPNAGLVIPLRLADTLGFREAVNRRVRGRNQRRRRNSGDKALALVAMLVRADGSFVGSVGGECMEAEVWAAAKEVLATERPQLLEFTLTEDCTAGVIDVGTQSALVRLSTERYVLLDSYALGRAARRFVSEMTDGGERLEAIINLHPFHTIHVRAVHAWYPQAALYGTERHHRKLPDLPWARTQSEDPALHEQYAGDFDFTVPRGVDFVSADDNVHFASVMAYHRASKTIYSDDTVNYLRLPQLARWAGLGDSVGFHPTLSRALQRRAGAARDFREWADELIKNWGAAENLCAAHTAALLKSENQGDSIRKRLKNALRRVESTLASHQRKHG